MFRWSARRVLVLIALLNLLLGVGLLSLRSPLYVPKEPAALPDLPPQIQQLSTLVEAGRHGESYSLSLSDAELTDSISYFIHESGDVPFDRVRVEVGERSFLLEGVTRGTPLPLPLRALGEAGVVEGRPWARVNDVSLVSTDVPAFVREQLLRRANDSLDLSRYDLPVTVDALELASGRMTLRGSVK